MWKIGDRVIRTRDVTYPFVKDNVYTVEYVAPNGNICLTEISRSMWEAVKFTRAPEGAKSPPYVHKYAPGKVTPRVGHPLTRGSQARVYPANGCCGLAELYGVSYQDPAEFFNALAWCRNTIFYSNEKTEVGDLLTSVDQVNIHALYVLVWPEDTACRTQKYIDFIEANRLGKTTDPSGLNLNTNSGNCVMGLIFTPDRERFRDFLWNIRVNTCTFATRPAAA